MNILQSPIIEFFKNFEKRAEKFYYRTFKSQMYSLKMRLKVKRLLKKKPRITLTKSQKQEIRSFYQNFEINNVNLSWHQFYFDCNKKFSTGYIPENLFYNTIEPLLNLSDYYPALADKNLLDKLFSAFKQPETVIKNINGYFYNEDKLITLDDAISYCKVSEDMIIKPTVETGGGKNIILISKDDVKTQLDQRLRKLFSDYKKDFIVQKKLIQHKTVSELNPSSLNTFRVMSYFNESEIKILSIIIRMGRKGSVTDNSTTGGISCGVQTDGTLNDVGFQLSGEQFVETDTGLKFKDIRLPFIEKLQQTAIELHELSPYFRIISWDLAVDALGDVVLIEYNIRGQDINFHQLNNGPVMLPLLKELKN